MGKTYGYARVSSQEQHIDRQLLALEEFGVPPKDVFTDRQSGKDFERPQYRRLLRKLRTDDVLVVKSIDRLGRNYSEILEQWRFITKEKRAAMKNAVF
ncbi:MAG: recombinase family protein [Selenomonadaceae bacterium]|nr:recombinase family protein [Selenomonadaceae bacterium]